MNITSDFKIECPFGHGLQHLTVSYDDSFELSCGCVASVNAIMLKNGNEQELADLRSDPQWYGLSAPVD